MIQDEKLNKLKVKCGKLEDALLSLEEENMKLNRYVYYYLNIIYGSESYKCRRLLEYNPWILSIAFR